MTKLKFSLGAGSLCLPEGAQYNTDPHYNEARGNVEVLRYSISVCNLESGGRTRIKTSIGMFGQLAIGLSPMYDLKRGHDGSTSITAARSDVH